MSDIKFNRELLPGLDPTRPIVISGPCSAETEEQVMTTARQLAGMGVKIFRAGIWKPRTRPGAFEGVGSEGLAWMKRVKRETGMFVATEVASAQHVYSALKAGIDLLWIGARTTVNPFLMQEIADSLQGVDVPVLIKNPVNPDLDLWTGAIERLAKSGLDKIGIIHRGFSAGDKSIYRNHPKWQVAIELHRRFPELPMFCDPSHMGGRRELIGPLSQQAMDLDFDGLFVETHCDPDKAWSDAAQQITPEVLKLILSTLVIRDAGRQHLSKLAEYRTSIDEYDDQLVELLGKRMEVCREIGVFKRDNNMQVQQAAIARGTLHAERVVDVDAHRHVALHLRASRRPSGHRSRKGHHQRRHCHYARRQHQPLTQAVLPPALALQLAQALHIAEVHLAVAPQVEQVHRHRYQHRQQAPQKRRISEHHYLNRLYSYLTLLPLHLFLEIPTHLRQPAFRAPWPACLAHIAPVQYQPVVRLRKQLRRYILHQFALRLQRCL